MEIELHMFFVCMDSEGHECDTADSFLECTACMVFHVDGTGSSEHHLGTN